MDPVELKTFIDYMIITRISRRVVASVFSLLSHSPPLLFSWSACLPL